jgi:predicted DNA-binding transcriptional regulator AlpA
MTSPGVRLIEIAHFLGVTKQRAHQIAEVKGFLGVTKQRAHQIAEVKGFPAPIAEDSRGRVWSRYEVQAWAKRWQKEKPWRQRRSEDGPNNLRKA